MSGSLGRYEILRPLGRGGMADVFLARRRSGAGIEKRLVVKRIRQETARDPGIVELFVREARVSMALSHQNIVPVFDFGRVDDALFLAMELVDGRDLGAVIVRALERGETMSPALVAFVGAECCKALAYAHDKRFATGGAGVIHRDVTPRNILVSWSGEVRLTDFGVAALRTETEQVVRGTPAYMAPEQARREPIDGRADLYALGLVLRHAATGAPARPADPQQALPLARSGELPPLPELPGGLGEVIARATAARPEDRHADARAMGDALHRVAAALRGDRGSPGHLLADWLRALFPEAQDDAGASAQDPSPMDAVTFLDDGEAAVMGTATARSLAGTVADLHPPAHEPPPEPAPEATPGRGDPARVVRRQTRAALAVLAIVAVGGAVAVWIALHRDGAPAAASGPPDATPAAVVVDAAVTPDAAVEVASAADALDAAIAVDATPPDSGGAVARPARVDAGAAATAPTRADAAPAALRRVTIGSRPWSAFYVDDDPTRHETPETVELSPGPHQIRFVNEHARVDKTITLDVPADRDLRHTETLLPGRP